MRRLEYYNTLLEINERTFTLAHVVYIRFLLQLQDWFRISEHVATLSDTEWGVFSLGADLDIQI
jgi:hypothetical protein